jgi:hypothetical protein
VPTATVFGRFTTGAVDAGDIEVVVTGTIMSQADDAGRPPGRP